jgi:methylglyoxal synthase
MMPSSSKSTNLTPTVALLASPSRIDEMISWVTRNAVSLSGCALVASPKELKEKLQVAQQLALDARMLSIKVETLGDDDNVADALVAQKVLAGQVRGVVWFEDYKQ